MKPSHIVAVTRRVFRGFRHDKRAMALMIFSPLLSMTVFGIAFSGNITNINIIIVNKDTPVVTYSNETLFFSQAIIDSTNKNILHIEYMDDNATALQKVREGKSWAVIEFPENFTRDILSRAKTEVTIRADKSNQNVYQALLKALRDGAQKFMDSYHYSLPVTINDSNAIYGAGADFSDFLIPGVITFAIFLLTTLLTMLTFTTERVNRTLDRLLATPATELEIVLGYALAFGCIGTLQAIVMVSYGIAVFSILVVGDILLAFLIAALLATTSQALGILLSAAARSEAQAIQTIPVIVLPAFLLSGIFWPLEAMPYWLHPFSYLLPPTYAAAALRSIMIRGWGVAEIWPEIAALLVFLVVFLGAAAISLKRRR